MISQIFQILVMAKATFPKFQIYAFVKCQIKPQVNWFTIDSPKKINKQIWVFCCESMYGKKITNFFVRFLGEFMARQSAYGFI